MAWPPTTHQDVQDEISGLRGTGVIVRHGQYAGLWYTSPGDTTTATAPTLDRLCYVPVWIPTGTVNGLGCRVGTAAAAASGSVVRMGLYSAGASGEPSTRLVDAGTASTETATSKEFTVSVAVSAGLYFVASVCQVTVSTTTLRVSTSADGSSFGMGQSAPAVAALHGFTQLSVSGALPATATPLTVSTAIIRGWYKMEA
jgi:hypothetical protein